MHKRILVVLAALILSLSVVPAKAQASASCRNKVSVDSVYQTGTGGNNYEYFIQLRNAGSTQLSTTLDFRNLPSNIIAFSPRLANVTIKAYQSQTIKFAKGTNPNVSSNTFRIYIDTTDFGPSPLIAISHCSS